MITKWSESQLDEFKTSYPKKGKAWCMEFFQKSEGQIRSMASRMKLKAAGVSEAWREERKKHSKRMTGRKRPDQAVVMKRLIAEGKIVITEEKIRQSTKRLNDWVKNNPHPKGSLGMRHSDEFKKNTSERSKKMWEGFDEKTKQEFAMRASQTARKVSASNRATGKSSWRSGWREIGGNRIFARSSWEANYARILQRYEDLGKIICWEHEPETFWFDGIKRGCMSYLPDFRVTTNDGDVEYHEVKGWMDSRSATAIKRMGIYHKDKKLIVIGKKEYMKLRGEWRFQIDEWED